MRIVDSLLASMGVVVVVKTLEDNANMTIINVKLTIDATWTFIEVSLATLCCPAHLQISVIALRPTCYYTPLSMHGKCIEMLRKCVLKNGLVCTIVFAKNRAKKGICARVLSCVEGF